MKCNGGTLGRRSFMQVGFLGGLGLSLSDFFRMKEAQAEQKFYESKEGTAKSVVQIYFWGAACSAPRILGPHAGCCG